MRAEQQYIDLFSQCEAMICRHSAEVLNAPRAQAFADFEKLGYGCEQVVRAGLWFEFEQTRHSGESV